jgi:hypothetical protein
MASARNITSDIWADEWFGSLTFMQQALWIGLFSKCADMQGRMRDIPTLIRSQVWPYQDVPIDDINEALAIFDDAHKLYRYEVNGKLYIQLLRWWAYQCTKFAGESLFPPPPEWIDHVNTHQGTTEIKRNWTNFKDHAAQESTYVIPSTEINTDASTEINTAPHIHINIPIHNQNHIHDDGVPSSAANCSGAPILPPPRKSTRQREPVLDNAALQAYQGVFHCRPNREQCILITEKVIPSSIEQWKDVLKAWRLHDYSPKNVPSMLDWFRDGIPKNGNGKPHARAAPGLPPQIIQSADEAMRRNVEDNGDWLQ